MNLSQDELQRSLDNLKLSESLASSAEHLYFSVDRPPTASIPTVPATAEQTITIPSQTIHAIPFSTIQYYQNQRRNHIKKLFKERLITQKTSILSLMKHTEKLLLSELKDKEREEKKKQAEKIQQSKRKVAYSPHPPIPSGTPLPAYEILYAFPTSEEEIFPERPTSPCSPQQSRPLSPDFDIPLTHNDHKKDKLRKILPNLPTSFNRPKSASIVTLKRNFATQSPNIMNPEGIEPQNSISTMMLNEYQDMIKDNTTLRLDLQSNYNQNETFYQIPRPNSAIMTRISVTKYTAGEQLLGNGISGASRPSIPTKRQVPKGDELMRVGSIDRKEFYVEDANLAAAESLDNSSVNAHIVSADYDDDASKVIVLPKLNRLASNDDSYNSPASFDTGDSLDRKQRPQSANLLKLMTESERKKTKSNNLPYPYSPLFKANEILIEEYNHRHAGNGAKSPDSYVFPHQKKENKGQNKQSNWKDASYSPRAAMDYLSIADLSEESSLRLNSPLMKQHKKSPKNQNTPGMNKSNPNQQSSSNIPPSHPNNAKQSAKKNQQPKPVVAIQIPKSLHSSRNSSRVNSRANSPRKEG
jgi:hypothetical protein